MNTDTDRLNFFEQVAADGGCPGLINDDAGRWALVYDGTQNMPNPDQPTTIWTSFVVHAEEWCDTAREAIDKAMDDYQ